MPSTSWSPAWGTAAILEVLQPPWHCEDRRRDLRTTGQWLREATGHPGLPVTQGENANPTWVNHSRQVSAAQLTDTCYHAHTTPVNAELPKVTQLGNGRSRDSAQVVRVMNGMISENFWISELFQKVQWNSK